MRYALVGLVFFGCTNPAPHGTVVASTGLGLPLAVVVDEQAAYIVSASSYATTVASVIRVSLTGESTTALASAAVASTNCPASSIAMDVDSVYFASAEGGGPTIVRASKDGTSSASVMLSGPPLAVNSTSVFATMVVGATGPLLNYALQSAPKSGGTVLTLAQMDSTTPCQVIADDAKVYWSFLKDGVDRRPEVLMRANVDGSDVQVLQTRDIGTAVCTPLAMDATTVYWWNVVADPPYSPVSVLVALDKVSDQIVAMTMLGSQDAYGAGMTADATNVYWPSTIDIRYLPRTGGSPQALALFDGYSEVEGLNAAASQVFWVDTAGELRKVSAP